MGFTPTGGAIRFQIVLLYMDLCDPFSRAPHRRWGRWDAEEGHGDPS
jgi:hypothetical protein